MSQVRQGTEPATGGCLCGAVRYEITGPPRDVINCHDITDGLPQFEQSHAGRLR